MDITVEVLRDAIVEHGHGEKLRDLAAQRGMTEDEFLGTVVAGMGVLLTSLTTAMTTLTQIFNDAAFQASLLKIALEKLCDLQDLEEDNLAVEIEPSSTG